MESSETIFIVVTTKSEEQRLLRLVKEFNVKMQLIGGDFAISGATSELHKFQVAWYG